MTFSLSARSDEYFYETIEGPVFLRGGFFVGGEDDQSAVDFAITDPDGEFGGIYGNLACLLLCFLISRKTRNRACLAVC